MRADFHTHSNFSFDADPAATLAALCEAAIEKGLSHLAVTDHSDLNANADAFEHSFDPGARFDAFRRVKAEYAGRLTLLFGIELGEANRYPDTAAAVLSRYPYDVVLSSLHNLEGEKDFYYFDFAPLTDSEIAALFDRVLDETEQLCDIPGTHIITHLTYLHRYVRRDGREMDFTPFTKRLCAIFEKMIARGLALEVNTSTLCENGGVTMPTAELIALYRKCGGRLISLGSDAHRPADIAKQFDRAEQMLRDCGFTELAVPTAGGILRLPLSRK